MKGMAKQRTAREALVEALRRKGEPMQAKDAVAAAAKLATGLKSDKTRKGTLYGTMREEALKPDGLIVKVGTGMYALRPESESSEETQTEPEAETPTADVQVEPHPKPTARVRRTRTRKQTAAA